MRRCAVAARPDLGRRAGALGLLPSAQTFINQQLTFGPGFPPRFSSAAHTISRGPLPNPLRGCLRH
jgi:hypothetical protein